MTDSTTASTVCWAIAAVFTVIWAVLKIYGNVRVIRRNRARATPGAGSRH